MTSATWSPKPAHTRPIPVVDLFAGPGGLGEGFSSVADCQGRDAFSVRVSIEKDPVAHQTLTLRAFFRSFGGARVPDSYYDYVRGDVSRPELFAAHPSEIEQARSEARLATLGETSESTIDSWIGNAIGDASHWVLIGGPPCQAYSLAGRSRRRPVDAEAFDSDERHLLYRQYLRIIEKFRPPVFVMENVKGILTSSHEGGRIFGKILADLSRPAPDLEYSIRSFAVTGSSGELEPENYILRSEQYGIPQTRHRVILLGVRSDLASVPHQPLMTKPPVSVWETIGTLPRARSRLSREDDSHEAWLKVFSEVPPLLTGCSHEVREAVRLEMAATKHRAAKMSRTGGRFIQHSRLVFHKMPLELADWLRDDRLDGVLQHETRSHMRSDLHRYLYASSFSKAFGRTPMLRDYPQALLPAHVNIKAESTPFLDRFRVQTGALPSTTVVSHISKDGHYYIHPDPAQCRSLTVREAARLQTFPDNYFFEGNRTEQYVQVGNAVPPLLAVQLGEVVLDLLNRAGTRDTCRSSNRTGHSAASVEHAEV